MLSIVLWVPRPLYIFSWSWNIKNDALVPRWRTFSKLETRLVSPSHPVCWTWTSFSLKQKLQFFSLHQGFSASMTSTSCQTNQRERVSCKKIFQRNKKRRDRSRIFILSKCWVDASLMDRNPLLKNPEKPNPISPGYLELCSLRLWTPREKS